MSADQRDGFPGPPMFEIVIAGHGLRCPAEGRVLLEMERQGKKFLPVGCRGGGCGICRVEVLRGRYRTLKMSRLHVSVEEQRRGFALACRLVPESDLELRPARRQAH